MKQKLLVTNLLLSQIITALFLIYASIIWFPYALSFFIDFAFHAKLLILANLILGPFLVMIIYKEGKRGLKMDLYLLFIIQISAFAFGAYSIYQKHPAYAVFTVDRFTLISAREAAPEKTNYSELQSNPLFNSTKMAYAKMPVDHEKRNAIMMEHMFQGKADLDGRPEYYEPYMKHRSQILEKSIPLKQITANENNTEKLSQFLRKHGGNSSSYAYLPLQNRNQYVIWVLDKITAQPIGILDIDPWELTQPQPIQQLKVKSKAHRWLI